MELVDVMKRRRVSVTFLQETKWGGKVINFLCKKERHKKWSRYRCRQGFERENCRVKRFGDRIIVIKLVLKEDIIHIISAYAPQARLDESVKSQFWEEIDALQ